MFLSTLIAATPAFATIVPRPSGLARFDIIAKDFQNRPWREAAANALRVTLEKEIADAFPFINWSETPNPHVVFVGSIRDLPKRGVVLDYHAEVNGKRYATGLPPTLLFSVHGQKPTDRNDLERPVDAAITTDFRTDRAVEKVVENIFGHVVLAREVRPMSLRLVVLLPFHDLRMARGSKLRVELSSRLEDTAPYETGSIELTPVRKRVTEPHEGAVEASIAHVDFPPLTPSSHEVATIVQMPPAERVEVFLATFIKASAYDADAAGNALTSR